MIKAWLAVVWAAVGCASTTATDNSSREGGRTASLVITEVDLHYTATDNVNRILRMDPARVDLVFFEDSARNTYFAGLRTQPPAEDTVLVTDLISSPATREFFQTDTRPAGATVRGFPGSVTVRVNDGWYRIRDVAVVQELVIYYQSPDARRKYQLKLPLRPSTIDGAFEDFGADVVFWNREAMIAYRRGLHLMDKAVSNPAIARLDGRYIIPLVRSDTIFEDVLHRPERSAESGRFEKMAGELCYHFENCQWVCSGN